MTVSELWEYACRYGLCDHEIIVDIRHMDDLIVDNVLKYDGDTIYLEGE